MLNVYLLNIFFPKKICFFLGVLFSKSRNFVVFFHISRPNKIMLAPLAPSFMFHKTSNLIDNIERIEYVVMLAIIRIYS